MLTAFGIFWGIFMLVVLMGGSRGVQGLLYAQFDGFATNSGFLSSSQTTIPYKGFQQGRYWHLENGDVARIAQQAPEIEALSPCLNRWDMNAVYGERSISGSLSGIYPAYAKIETPTILYGRFINDIDIQERRKVCVIGKRIHESLFPQGENPCGKYISVNGMFYQVVGVNVATGNLSIQGDAQTTVTLPFSTLQQNYNYGNNVHLLAYTARPGFSIAEVQEKAAEIVRRNHLIHPDDKSAVMLVNAQAMFSVMDNLFEGIRLLSWMIGLGTLLAGAIGVSNIMMVTVKERTSEIGIRRAIGARPLDVLWQILSESMVLTLLAGLGGLTFAVGILQLTEEIVLSTGGTAHFQISFGMAVGACAMLVCLGTLAGLAPAFRAMAIRPIEAIQDE